jgi:hypothetical protein
MPRFVSDDGPDLPGVRFHKSFPPDAYPAAQHATIAINEERGPEAVAVIYRVSYSEAETKFYESRQLNPNGDGNERHAGEPGDEQILGYDLFSVPKTLLPRDSWPALNDAVGKVYNFSHGPRPGSRGP